MKHSIFFSCILSFLLVIHPVFAEKAYSPTVPITVKIDFGPADRPSIEKKIRIQDQSTPKEALKSFISVEEGFVCCHDGEIKGIGGVGVDPIKNRWWLLKINGSAKNANPQKTKLKAGDLMEWVYSQEVQ